MLKLSEIRKTYESGDIKVEALKGIDLEMRDSEFVSILGPSGCGKTTLLNIIGGLDNYTSGDLMVRGVSTKRYKSKDWDAYRNHSIGFVFQNYNLIPHQTVLKNVELALTLSGVSRRDRKRRALEALDKVGLSDQVKKKPGQMSGGQMQRVAIARALVNDPDILLADEPTGALDTTTSVQIMELLAEVADNKLVIMVTHNPELAQTYSTRIIKLLDGKIQSDSMPVKNGDSDNPETDVYEFEPGVWKENEGNNLPAFDAPGDDDDLAPALEKLIPVEQTTEEMSKSPKELKKLYKLEVKKAQKAEKLEKKEQKKTEKKSKNAEKNAEKEQKKAEKKMLKAHRASRKSMKFFTALSLSFNNLLTKKGRTFLTSFAGSIGIIGIALILSISSGVQIYIDKVQEDTLSSYPLTIEKQTLNIASFMQILSDSQNASKEHDLDKIYTNTIMTDFIDAMLKEVSHNNLGAFKKYIEANPDKFKDLVSDIQYSYSTKMNIYRADTENGIFQVSPVKVFERMGMRNTGMSSGMGAGMGMETEIWTRLLDNDELLEKQYEVIAGKFPKEKDEVVLIVNDKNELVDYTLYALGIMDSDALTEAFRATLRGEENVSFPEAKTLTYDEILSQKFRLLTNTDIYEKGKPQALTSSAGTSVGTALYEGREVWIDKSEDEKFMKNAIDNGLLVNVCGIIRPKSDAAMSSSVNGRIGYRTSLMNYLIDEVNASEIVKKQKENPETDVFSGLKFGTDNSLHADSTYEDNLKILGVSDLSEPSTINIFPVNFESKDKIAEIVSEYNRDLPEDERLTYTDYVGLIMSSVTSIIDVISYILISFVAISLVVSSVMIGIITNISVLERTKEIGILRAVGASKRDIARVFNAETLIIGFTAGALGILITKLLLLPINAIIYHFTDIADIAKLPDIAALILVGISMLLTFTAGIFPAMSAARKDPVEALRSE
ncbi:MAG: ABC transporter ATP-binding protein/permease [Lachnospiraceae bacterium]|nr:ABC transporter ATP-binding protein/permease [Lachnospiraceae bacterium]